MLRIIVFILIFLIITGESVAQGCSDAGACSIDNLQLSPDSIQHANQIKLGINYGIADNSITATGGYLQYVRQLSNRINVDFKLTGISLSGNGITTTGVSDVFISSGYKVIADFTFLGGIKIPLSDGNIQYENQPLPMDYQPSLGTLDLIAGFGYKKNNLHIAAAIQQPVSQNKNEFVAEIYTDNSPLYYFHTTNKFKRGGDIILRTTYSFNTGTKFIVSPGILPVYHLRNDEYTNLEGERKEIKGSAGLTLNTNLFIDYKMFESNILQLTIGFPVVVREARPEGLTRSFIANLEYRVSF